jgi:ABC-2 type transport system permease protein
MSRTIRAELVKLARRRVLIATAASALVFAATTALIVLAAAEPVSPAGPAAPTGRPGVTVESLTEAGGGTEVFTTAVSFGGTFLFVVFVGAVAVEYSRGTFRTMLLRQPRRLALLGGKVAALVGFAAVALVVTEATTWVVARLLAPSFDIDPGAWASLAGLGAGVADLAVALAWMVGYAVLGTALAVAVRSVPLALGIGIAWAGPVEHLLQDAWSPASRFFPGLLLEAFVAGGTTDVSAARAGLTITAYVAVAAVLAGWTFNRRDMTA